MSRIEEKPLTQRAVNDPPLVSPEAEKKFSSMNPRPMYINFRMSFDPKEVQHYTPELLAQKVEEVLKAEYFSFPLGVSAVIGPHGAYVFYNVPFYRVDHFDHSKIRVAVVCPF